MACSSSAILRWQTGGSSEGLSIDGDDTTLLETLEALRTFNPDSQEAMAQLNAHPWPGNVRELKNVVERSLYRWGDGSREVAEIIIDPFTSPWDDAPDQPAPETSR